MILLIEKQVRAQQAQPDTYVSLLQHGNNLEESCRLHQWHISVSDSFHVGLEHDCVIYSALEVNFWGCFVAFKCAHSLRPKILHYMLNLPYSGFDLSPRQVVVDNGPEILRNPDTPRIFSLAAHVCFLSSGLG